MLDFSKLEKLINKKYKDFSESDFNDLKKFLKTRITELEEDYHHKLFQLQYELGIALNKNTNSTESIQIALRKTLEFTAFDFGAIYKTKSNELILAEAIGSDSIHNKEKFTSIFAHNIQLKLLQKELIKGSPATLKIYNDFFSKHTFLIIIPLIYKRQAIGALLLVSKTKETLDEKIENGLLSIASQIASMLGHTITIENLKINEERLSFALKASDEGLWDYNLDKNTMYFSPRWFTLLGFLPDELPHEYNTWLSLCHPEDVKELEESIKNKLTKNAHFIVEHRLKTKQGKYIWIKSNGIVVDRSENSNPKRIIGTNVNIDERKKIEERLKQERDFNVNLTETSPIGIGVLDKNGKITYANKEAETILGLKKDDITSLSYNDPEWKITDFEGKPFKNSDLPFSIVKRTLKSVFNVQHAIEKSNGERRYLSINSSPLLDEYNKFNGTIVTLQDLTHQILAEKKIKESEHKFQLLFENLTSGFAYHKIITDSKNSPIDYIYLDINPAYEKLTGLKRENVIGKSVKEILPNLEPYWIEMFGKVALTGKSIKYENYVKELDRYYDTVAYSPIKGYFAVVFNDITKRKRADIEVKEREEHLKAIYRNITDALMIQVIKPDGTRGNFIEVNDVACKRLGYTREEMLNMSIFDIDDPDSEVDNSEKLTLLKKGENVIFEQVHVAKNGRKIPVEIHAASFNYQGQKAIISLVRDISERKLAEQELKIKESSFNSAINAIAISDLKGKITYVNPAFVQMWKLKNAEDAYAKNAVDFWKEPAKANEIIDILFSEGSYIGELKALRADQSTFDVQISGSLVKDEMNKPICIMGSFLDITVQKNAEIELIKAKEKAEESDRLKMAFLANMSHEIRTPMNGIIGFAGLLKNKELEQDKREKFSEIIDSSAKQLLRIITDIIDISKIEANQLQIFDSNIELKTLIDELVIFYRNELKNQHKENIELIPIIEQKDHACNLKTDAIRLKQVFSNLMDNALKFTSQGKIEFGYECKPNKVLFFVKDTGIGIARKEQEIIFDRFRQVEDSLTRNFGGTGLGLSICKGILDLMGGEIWLESEINKGSKFYFTLPVKEKAIIKEDKIYNRYITKPLWNTKTLLIVEDVISNLELIKAYVSTSNINIIHAKNGQEAVDIMKERNDIDVILMDIQLPILNGFEATLIIKTLKPNVPIIAQTAYAMSNDKEKALEAGCDDFITKPIFKDSLIQKLSIYLKN